MQPAPIQRLITELSRLPGVGQRTAQRLAFHILRAEDAELEPEKRKEIRNRLEEIRREILGGADFTEMIRRHSQADDADRGGMMTLKADARVFPAFADAVWALEIDEVSEVIELDDACYLMRVEEIQLSPRRPLSEVQEEIERTLEIEERASAEKHWIDRLKRKTFIRYY